MEDLKKYKTERLILQPTTVEDAAFFLKLLNTPKWLKNIGDRNVHTIEDAENYIRDRVYPMFLKNGYGNYTVIRKSDQMKIGSCGLYNRPGVEGVDIGFAFLPEFEHNGYGYESAHFLMNLGFREFNLSSISAITSKENTASQNLLKKLGLSFVKMIRLPNDKEELMLFNRSQNKK